MKLVKSGQISGGRLRFKVFFSEKYNIRSTKKDRVISFAKWVASSEGTSHR